MNSKQKYSLYIFLFIIFLDVREFILMIFNYVCHCLIIENINYYIDSYKIRYGIYAIGFIINYRL